MHNDCREAHLKHGLYLKIVLHLIRQILSDPLVQFVLLCLLLRGVILGKIEICRAGTEAGLSPRSTGSGSPNILFPGVFVLDVPVKYAGHGPVCTEADR